MDFAQLRDADIDSLEALLEPWRAAATKLDDGADVATTEVGDRIRDGRWKGAAAGTAKTRVAFLSDQLGDGKTEADTVVSLLTQAVPLFTKARKRLHDLIAKVDNIDGLSLDNSGHVTVAAPDKRDWLTGPVLLVRQLSLFEQARVINKEIADTIGDAREIDGQLATALRAAVGADDPDDLDFNPTAATDGAVQLGSHTGPGLPMGLDMYVRLAGMAGREPFDDRPPAEQSATIGAMVKAEVERAGGHCKFVEGLMVCVGAPSTMYARGGTTFGDTFVSPYRNFEELDRLPGREELLNHEKYHRDHQWREDGVSFARKYLVEEARSQLSGYTNRYEADAEEFGGRTGYDVKRPPG